MGSRRGHGEGSIYQRADNGLWCTAVDLGYEGGKRKRKYIYGKTRKEVAEKLKVILRDQQRGLPIAVERQTIAQFFDRWLNDVVKPNTRPKTYESYREIARLHIIPSIGRVQLDKLTPQDVQRLLNQKLTEGLSPRTVQYIRAVVRMALGQALKWGMVVRNVATLVDPPKLTRSSTRALNSHEARQLLDAARGDRLEALYRVALSLGLRRGEALELRWEDVDLEKRTLRVAVALQIVDGKPVLVEPKTANSRRALLLPSALVDALRVHHTRQLTERMLAGSRWKDHGLVFPTTIGTPINPPNLVRTFHELLERAGLPPMRFHDLRHSCASLLAAAGISPKEAMETLGHSDIRTTLSIYTHVLDDGKRRVADAMDRMLAEPDELLDKVA